MKNTDVPDFTKAPPRSGNLMLGSWPWLARLSDKVRAEQAGTHADYVAYCGISRPFLEICGVGREQFDELIRSGASDDDLVRWFDEHVDAERREAARRFILVEKADGIAQQDRDEGRA
jgi:hypothetical protein